MKAKHRTGYGTYDLSRQIARRVQLEWEAVESSPLPKKHTAEVIPFPAPGDSWPLPPSVAPRPLVIPWYPYEKRPLAA